MLSTFFQKWSIEWFYYENHFHLRLLTQLWMWLFNHQSARHYLHCVLCSIRRRSHFDETKSSTDIKNGKRKIWQTCGCNKSIVVPEQLERRKGVNIQWSIAHFCFHLFRSDQMITKISHLFTANNNSNNSFSQISHNQIRFPVVSQ